MRVSVFGGSQASPGSIAYGDAQALGKALARLGHTVMTGGYAGTMEAVSRGASTAGGHVIGVTCLEIERSHGVRPSPWVAEELRKQTLMERLETLIQDCDAAVVMPGGPGTLTEMALMWNLMIVRAFDPKPLILVGEAWRDVMDQFFARLGDYSPPAQRALITFVPNPAAAVKLLEGMSI